jgi:hypothetical protein
VLARLTRVFLVVALLAGWQAALQHPIEHVDELGEFIHLHDGHAHDDGSQSGSLCDLLAALTACAPQGLHPVVATAQPAHLAPLHREGAPRVAQAPPFLSQGPPLARV